MALRPVLQFFLPGLLLGAVSGVLVGNTWATAHGTSAKKSGSPREEFLASGDEEDGLFSGSGVFSGSDEASGVNYEKLAGACLAAVQRGSGSGSASRQGVSFQFSTPADAARVDEAKKQLDAIMSRALEVGQWTPGAGSFSSRYLGLLEPSDAEDFKRILRTAIERGDLRVQAGAWTPEAIN